MVYSMAAAAIKRAALHRASPKLNETSSNEHADITRPEPVRHLCKDEPGISVGSSCQLRPLTSASDSPHRITS